MVDKIYKIKDETYGHSKYHNKQEPKPNRKICIMLQSCDSEKPASYTITKYNPTIHDWVQRFNLHSQINARAAIETRLALSNVYPDKYKLNRDRFIRISTQLALELKERMPSFEEIWNEDAMEQYIMTRNKTLREKHQICRTKDLLKGYTIMEILRENWSDFYVQDGKLYAHGLKNPISIKSRFMCFIKDESYYDNKRPRNITGASDIDKFIFGSVFGEFNHAFFSRPETIKKVPYEYRSKVITERLGPCRNIYGTDFTAFESSSTYEVQDVMEQNVYRIVYPEFYEYAKKYQLPMILRTGYVDYNTYYLDTSRASGAPNTSLGNSINNYCFIKSLEEEFDCNIKFLIEGDDCIMNVDKHLDTQQVYEYALSQGFDLKIDEFQNYGDVGFLSLTWDPDNLVPDMSNVWKHLIDAISFRPHQVSYNDKTKTMSNRTYWNRLTSKLMSLVLLAPKHELIWKLFEASYDWKLRVDGLRKLKTTDKYKMKILGNDAYQSTKEFKEDLIDRIRNHTRLDLNYQIRQLYSYGEQHVQLIDELLSTKQEKDFLRAFDIICEIYYKNREKENIIVDFR